MMHAGFYMKTETIGKKDYLMRFIRQNVLQPGGGAEPITPVGWKELE